MKNKKGFVFVETIIVIATVLAGLLAIYVSYSNMVRNERRRVRYDEPSFIYKTYSIGQFLITLYDDDGNAIIYNKVKEYKNINNYYFNIPPNDIDFFSTEYVGDNANRKEFYSKMLQDLHVQNVIVISKTKIDEINTKYSNSSTRSQIINLIPNNLLYYILSMNVNDDANDSIYLIVEFAEKVNGDECSPNQLAEASANSTSGTNSKSETSCTFYYANMKLEGV